MKHFSLFLALLGASSCASHSAQNSTAVVTPAPFEFHLPGAPEPGSSEDKSDHDKLLALQKSRTAAECARGSSEVKITLDSYFGPAYGPLSEKEVAALTPVVNQLTQDVWQYIGAAKDHWKRPRPYIAHTDLNPCAKKEPSSSYPSGHSAISHYLMHVLTTLYPERKAAIEARAEQIALDRTIVGVHYPTDIRDGKLLGDQIYEYLEKTPKYQALIREAQISSHQ